MDLNIRKLERLARTDPEARKAYHKALVRLNRPLPIPPSRKMNRRNKQRFRKHYFRHRNHYFPNCRFCRKFTRKPICMWCKHDITIKETCPTCKIFCCNDCKIKDTCVRCYLE